MRWLRYHGANGIRYGIVGPSIFGVNDGLFGGIHAMLGLTESGADASVAFHGVGMHKYLDGADRITKPYSFHFGEKDPIVPLDQVELVRSTLAGKDGEVHVYSGAAHAFAQVESENYHPEAATLSEQRAFAVLDGLK
jgi:carboxymethylenebutenolidase